MSTLADQVTMKEQYGANFNFAAMQRNPHAVRQPVPKKKNQRVRDEAMTDEALSMILPIRGSKNHANSSNDSEHGAANSTAATTPMPVEHNSSKMSMFHHTPEFVPQQPSVRAGGMAPQVPVSPPTMPDHFEPIMTTVPDHCEPNVVSIPDHFAPRAHTLSAFGLTSAPRPSSGGTLGTARGSFLPTSNKEPQENQVDHFSTTTFFSPADHPQPPPAMSQGNQHGTNHGIPHTTTTTHGMNEHTHMMNPHSTHIMNEQHGDMMQYQMPGHPTTTAAGAPYNQQCPPHGASGHNMNMMRGGGNTSNMMPTSTRGPPRAPMTPPPPASSNYNYNAFLDHNKTSSGAGGAINHATPPFASQHQQINLGEKQLHQQSLGENKKEVQYVPVVVHHVHHQNGGSSTTMNSSSSGPMNNFYHGGNMMDPRTMIPSGHSTHMSQPWVEHPSNFFSMEGGGGVSANNFPNQNYGGMMTNNRAPPHHFSSGGTFEGANNSISMDHQFGKMIHKENHAPPSYNGNRNYFVGQNNELSKTRRKKQGSLVEGCPWFESEEDFWAAPEQEAEQAEVVTQSV